MQCEPVVLGGIFDYELKKDRLAEVELELGEASVWERPDYAQALGKEKAELDRVVSTIDQLYSGISDTEELFLLAQEESDDDLLQEAESDLVKLEQSLAELEFRRMFSGSMDGANAYLDIQAGSGGTEAQDWAEMLLRMYLRWSEAKAGAFKVGCKEEHLHFLDLPFYRTGTINKHPWGTEDVKIIRDLLTTVRPDQIYVAGDLSDPHGTHRVCAEAIFETLRQLKEEEGWCPDVLLYRGAWQEYALHELHISVPLSPSNMELKKKAIFMHESQKDEALFPGSDPREFWQRAEDRNCGTAKRFNEVGLPEYFAMEAFVRWDGVPI